MYQKSRYFLQSLNSRRTKTTKIIVGFKLVLAYCNDINHNFKQKSYGNSFRFTAQANFVINSYKTSSSELKLAWIARFHDPVTT